MHAYLHVCPLSIREKTLKTKYRNPSKSAGKVLNFPFLFEQSTPETVHRIRLRHRWFALAKVQFSLIFHLLIKLLRLSFVSNEKFNFFYKMDQISERPSPIGLLIWTKKNKSEVTKVTKLIPLLTGSFHKRLIDRSWKISQQEQFS